MSTLGLEDGRLGNQNECIRLIDYEDIVKTRNKVKYSKVLGVDGFLG